MAKSSGNLDTTQRAYTLRLRGATPNDHSWRDALWATHEAVNKGCKVFGDWLLTLRGGLCHTLVEEEFGDRPPSNEERRNRRILLALSWLSVESEKGAPASHLVAHDVDTRTGTRSNWKTVFALRSILRNRGLDDDTVEDWVEDCSDSLIAAIRDDAVWVNRSAAFDKLCSRLTALDRAYAGRIIFSFFGEPDEYLAMPRTDDEDASTVSKSNESPEFRTLARQWVSTHFGTGEKSDNSAIVEALGKLASADLSGFCGGSRAALLKHLVSLLDGSDGSDDLESSLASAIGWKGRPSKGRLAITKLPDPVSEEGIEAMQSKLAEEKADKEQKVGHLEALEWMPEFRKVIEGTCGMPFVDERNHTGEFSVMLDHAARRVSIGHSWIKRAEASRQKFQEDANKLQAVPTEARKWLDQFCQERSTNTGAFESYRIRRRAIDGWKDVVEKWANSSCKTVEDRIATARNVQANPDIEKFGDIQLFEALAADEAKCVWHPNGNATPQPLIDYVTATDAQARQKRFKVPAYRHPDPLAHPVFCDFGNSRWNITFSVHEAYRNLDKAKQDCDKKQQIVEKALEALGKSKPEKKADKQKKLSEAQEELSQAKEKLEKLSDSHRLAMTLWNGQAVESTALWWRSKKLSTDLAMEPSATGGDPVEVSRADRLGRAAAGVGSGEPAKITSLFEQKDWNGRLQAPRAQLDAIAKRVAEHGWDNRAQAMRDQLQWLVTFSAKLQPQGPWCDYAREHNLNINPKYWPHAEVNKNRKGHAKLILSRLPGLRVLSVDLGHRYAASCAVWETMTSDQMHQACQDANHGQPTPADMYLHLSHHGADGKARTTVYRRIGADYIEHVDSDTGELTHILHPAPWARLDRQFIIKLQGEEKKARKASPDEIKALEDFEAAVGRIPSQRRSLCVSDLMSQAVRTARFAMRDHGDLARIAYNLMADEKLLPGGQEQTLSQDDRIELLQDILVLWHGLTSKSDPLKVLWNEHIATLANYAVIKDTNEDVSGKVRKAQRNQNRAALRGVAESLVINEPLRQKLHCQLATLWREQDKLWRGYLRWLRDWILPRGLKANSPAIRHVGGLSLDRIATIKLLYQVQKAFFMRPEPGDLKKNIPAKGQRDLQGFGRRILDTMEHLREQRIKQLASRIAEAALGIGRKRPSKKRRDSKRPRSPVDGPCHAVVIENLTHYRPEETRPRRENRQLMSWAAAKVKKYLSEACELHGLHLREIQASYTSRQDSRTGSPGIRCCDVPIKEFKTAPWWRQKVENAKKKIEQAQGNALHQYLIGLDGTFQTGACPDSVSLRIPVPDGDVFVSADPNSPAAKGLQADLNAAANIGLKALLDPDWSGKWWYVPCESKTGKPVKDKVQGASCIDTKTPLYAPIDATGKKNKQIINLWHDSAVPMGDSWQSTRIYWDIVQDRVVKMLQESFELIRPKTIESTDTPW